MKKLCLKAIVVITAVLMCINPYVYTAVSENDESSGIQKTELSSETEQKNILENKDYALYFNPDTADVVLSERKSGYKWYSNYSDDSLSDANEKSQLVVYYYENNDLTSMNSYENCISSGEQLLWSSDDRTLTVSYDIGDDSFSSDALPMVLTKKRMENDILSKLSDKDKKTVLSKYTFYSKNKMDADTLKTIRINFPTIESNDLYIRTRMPDYIAEEIYGIFEAAGYTSEDLQRDCNENKIKNTYTEKPFFHIEMVYALTEDGFKVSIDPDKITFTEDYKPCRIDVLPYFGCAADEQGYMIVPDGCGAVIDFNNGKNNVDAYWKKFFEDDNALVKKEAKAACEPSVLPYFAVSKKESGFLATIDSGYEVAGTSAYVTGKANRYNRVYSFYDLYSFDKISISSGGQDEFILSSKKIISCPIEISYHFMPGNHTYSDFAVKYRDLLIEDGVLSRKKIADNGVLNIDLIGAAQVIKKFLGISYKKNVALTSYSQAKKLIEGLDADDVNVSYLDALKGNRNQERADNVNLLSVLGKREERDVLEKLCNSFSVSYYSQYASKLGKKDSAMTLGESRAELYKYNLISRYVSSEGALGVVAPIRLKTFSGKILKSLKKNGLSSVNLLDSGFQLNSDFSTENGLDRYKSRKMVQSYLSDISAKTAVTVNTGSIFSLPYIKGIKNIPTASSGYLIEDYTVPFYQIAVSGCLDYSVSSINTAVNSRHQFLKAVELGAGLQYTWAYNIPENITDDTAGYFKYYYKNSYEQAKSYYSDYVAFYNRLSGQAIISHECLADKLYKTVYDGGLKVYVNYNDKPLKAEGLTIEANGFAYSE